MKAQIHKKKKVKKLPKEDQGKILIRIIGKLEPIPATLNIRWEYTLDGMPAHPYTLGNWQFNIANSPTSMDGFMYLMHRMHLKLTPIII